MHSTDNQLPVSGRHYYLDWLRVIAFGLLILYHVGMFYVADWGWHIKSSQPSEFLQNLMYLTNPWRMSLLFFVSGAALFFACRKISRTALFKLRNWRLLLPLLFGMAVIVPPQVYIELTDSENMRTSYMTFYLMYLDATTTAYPEHQHGPLGLWTWNHLWFLAYLWVYTLLFLLVKPVLDRISDALGQRQLTTVGILVAPIVLLTIIRLWLAADHPPTNALFDDWYNHARYLAFLFGGYVVASHEGFWHVLAKLRWYLTGAAVVAYLMLLLVAHGEVQAALSFLDDDLTMAIIRLIVSCDHWLWIAALLGLGRFYLNRPSRLLTYMNDAILPWYMLHQTLIVVAAFLLAPFTIWQPLEAVLIIATTVLGCGLGYECVRRSRIGRLLFGLKPLVQSCARLNPIGHAKVGIGAINT